MYLPPDRDLTEAETDAFLTDSAYHHHGTPKDPAARAAAGLPENPPRDIAAEGALNAEEAADFGWSKDIEPVPIRNRRDGWMAWRQRLFLEMLAQTGCVSEAARAAGVTPRSAYRLRCRHDAASFNAAWDRALEVASNRLTAIAFERAIHGRVRSIRYKGEIVGEERVPSDRLLAYLLQHYDRTRYGNLSGFTTVQVPDPRRTAQVELPDLLTRLEDHRLPAEEPRRNAVTFAGDPPDPRAMV